MGYKTICGSLRIGFHRSHGRICIAAILLTIFAHSANAACEDIANLNGDSWTITDNKGIFGSLGGGLVQNETGHVTGSFVSSATAFCKNVATPPPTLDWAITGTRLGTGNGQFTLQAVNTGSTQCSTAISIGITLGGVGCNVVTTGGISITGGNQSGTSSNSISGAHQCYAPTSETVPVLDSWGMETTDGIDTTIAIWHQYLAGGFDQYPTTGFDWGGRTIQETFPSANSNTDTCWFKDSAFKNAAISNTNAPAFVIGSEEGYLDEIGPTKDRVDYYRQQARTPCSFTYLQKMVISCPSGQTIYQVNTLTMVLGDTTVSVTRGSSMTETETWGVPASTYSFLHILFNYIMRKGGT